MLLYLLAVVVVGLVGGAAVSVPTAVAAALLINYFFVEPLHTLQSPRATRRSPSPSSSWSRRW